MISIARYFSSGASVTELEERCLRQLVRELLLAQSSDWAFLIRSGTAREHLDRFNRLYAQLHEGRIETAHLENCEEHDNIFPRLNRRIYA
jgi:1,4-alpha-glucan branching enzyme